MSDPEDPQPATTEVVAEPTPADAPPFRTAAEWEAHVRWRAIVNTKQTVTDLVREAMGAPIDRLEDLVFRGDGITGADRVIAQSFRILNDLAKRAQSVELVQRRYRKQDITVRTLAEIKQLPLDSIDRALPAFGNTYELTASVSGGFNGALGTPGAVMGVPTLLFTSLHAISSYAYHFGHDLAEREEQEFAVMLLTAGLVTRPSRRGGVIRRLEDIAYHLEVDETNDDAEAHALAILENVAEAVVLRLLLGLLVRSWPGVGLLLGAGFSRAFVSHVCALSHAAYQQRWLFRTHGDAARVATTRGRR
jgi:hypothetical protein